MEIMEKLTVLEEVGAANVDSTTAAKGGDGAPGIVVVISYIYNGGADFAEWYETKDDVEAGDVVALSNEILEYDSQLGVAKIPILEKAKKGSNFIGVISSAPSQVIGEDIFTKAKRPRPVALSGRVPVKVSNENGEIKPGDLLTVSSLPRCCNESNRAWKGNWNGFGIFGKMYSRRIGERGM